MDDKCHVIFFNKEAFLKAAEHPQTVTLSISGMGCVSCANRVHNRLIDHPGVVKAEVSHVTATTEVTYIPTKVSVSHLIEMVAEAGDKRHTYNAVVFELGGV